MTETQRLHSAAMTDFQSASEAFNAGAIRRSAEEMCAARMRMHEALDLQLDLRERLFRESSM